MVTFLLSASSPQKFRILHRFCAGFCNHYGTGQFIYHHPCRWTSTSVFQRHGLHFSILKPCSCHFRVPSLLYRLIRVTSIVSIFMLLHLGLFVSLLIIFWPCICLENRTIQRCWIQANKERNTRSCRLICFWCSGVHKILVPFRLPTPAPANDLNLLKRLVQVESPSAKGALKKLCGQLWYLSEDLAALAFFDRDIE